MARVVAPIVSVAGLVVMLGWCFGWEPAKRIAPGMVAMKFSTAACFAMSGLMLACLWSRSEKLQGLGAGLALGVLVYMLSVCLDYVYGGALGIANAFVAESSEDVKTVAPGVPSLCTMVDFVLCGVSGALLTLRHFASARTLFLVVGASAFASLCGYSVGWPPLYCYIDGTSTAMALHTAILFGMLSVSGVALARESQDSER